MPAVYLNGSFVDSTEARVSIEDRGFQFAHGVYEVVRVWNGLPFRLSTHLDRLHRSASTLEIPLKAPDLPEVCAELIRRDGVRDGMIYLQVTAGAAPRTHTWEVLAPTVVAYARDLSHHARPETIRAITQPDDRWGRCDLKTTALLSSVLARQKAAREGCQEAIFVRDGVITEGAATNVFLVCGGTVFTHPSGNRILPGVTRSTLLELDRSIREEAVTLERARAAEEIFLVGTITEVAPVVQLDGRSVGAGRPGPVAQRMAAAYRALRDRECSADFRPPA